ncbi:MULTISPECIES: hypothetical protein [unclassified Kitasatospora]|uniref:hypothetical protein n=1 Tax=unclassified Kitasatospora TaxID=2633591 RepID=UPI0033DA6602
MAALARRAVGERLGHTTMPLYTYMPGKAGRLDLTYDRALARLPADPPPTDDRRAAVTADARVAGGTPDGHREAYATGLDIQLDGSSAGVGGSTALP